MPSLTVGTENSAPIEIHYEDREEDRILPFDATAARLPALIRGARLRAAA